MPLAARIRSSLRALFHRSRLDSEMDAELLFHIEARAADLAREGLSPEDALRRARLEFGAVGHMKEECRESRGIAWLHSLAQDIRYGGRMLRKSPGFTIVAVLTLALGIGANTAIFSALDCIVLKALPYPDSSQLVDLQATDTGGCPTPDFPRILAESRTLGPMALHSGDWGTTLIGNGAPERVTYHAVSADFMPLLEIQPLLGRWFVSSETEPGNEHVAILSYSLWRERFGSNPGILGRSIELMWGRPSEVTSFKVVGVMPPRFDFPQTAFGNPEDKKTQIWLPMALRAEDFATRAGPKQASTRFGTTQAIARVRPGYTLDDVNTELGVISSHLDKSDPEIYGNMRYWAKPLKKEVVSQAQLLLSILLGIAGFVLLIACANLANLFLSRGWARRPEMAVRATLGATRWRVMRQLLVECLLLSVAGGAAGFLLAFSSLGTLRHLLPPNTPRLDELSIDPAALWFTLGVSVLAAILFGLVPALMVSRQDPNEVMKEGGSRSSGALGSRAGRWLRDFLVAAEVALAFVLVFSAGLGLRSFNLFAMANMGFRTDHLLTFSFPFRPSQAGFNATEFSRSLLSRLSELPGVESVAGMAGGGFGWKPIHVTGLADAALRSLPELQIMNPTPKYFDTLDVPFKFGRDFTGEEKPGSLLVGIVSETLAEKYFGDANPVGRTMAFPGLDWGHPKDTKDVQIVGEVGDIRLAYAPAWPARAVMYLSYYQRPGLGIVAPTLRTSKDPALVIPAVRTIVSTIQNRDPIWKDDPPTEIMTVDQQIALATTNPRSRAILLGSFGALGLLLAAIGIYGVISYSVVQRTHEIGVRMALGAQPENVLRLVIGQGARPALAGVVLGFGGTWAFSRFLQVLIYIRSVKATDPLTFAGVSFLLVAVALAACYIPARRAMRVDPLTALRHE